MNLSCDHIDKVIDVALKEDIGTGDITTDALFGKDKDKVCKAVVRAKERGVIAGIPIAKRVFQKLDHNVGCVGALSDGEVVDSGDLVAEITLKVRAALSGERLALNILQRLSGIATLTSKYLKVLEGTSVGIIDTRKTAPGLRMLDKYAVSIGGGKNNRIGLYDGVLIKDNHIKLAGSIMAAVQAVRGKYGSKFSIEVETTTIEQVKEALKVKADIIMLDNMSLEQMRESVGIIRGKALVEASGGVTLKTIKGIAETGVDVVSIGALTHSSRALDIGIYML